MASSLGHLGPLTPLEFWMMSLEEFPKRLFVSLAFARGVAG